MDVLDFLRVIAPRCRLIASPADALSVLPDLGVDAPPLVPLPLASGPVPAIPVAFAEALRRPLANTLIDLITNLVKGAAAEGLQDLQPDVLGQDRLVRCLSRLLLEASGLGPRSCSLVMLELARQSATLLDGQLDELKAEAPELASRIKPPLEALLGQEGPNLARMLAALAWSLSARLAAAWTLAGRVDQNLRPTRLYQAIARNPMALVVPQGGLDLPADLEFAARLIGSNAEVGSLSAALMAVRAAVRLSLERRGGTLNPVQRALRDLTGERRDPQLLAFDPRVADWCLHGIKDLVSAKEMSEVGVPKTIADALLRGEGVGALAASYTQVCTTLREWDLLSTLAASVLPIEGGPGSFRSPLGPLTGPGPWALLGPRGAAGVQTAAVVVVRSGRALVELANVAMQTNNPSLVGALERRWMGLSGEAWASGGAISEGLGSSGLWIAAFPHVADARSFAEKVEKAFTPPIKLLGLDAGEVALPQRGRVDVQVRQGLCFGGWNGERLHVWGPAVEEALGVPHSPDEPDESAQSPARIVLQDLFPAGKEPAGPTHDPFAETGPVVDPLSSRRAAVAVSPRPAAPAPPTQRAAGPRPPPPTPPPAAITRPAPAEPAKAVNTPPPKPTAPQATPAPSAPRAPAPQASATLTAPPPAQSTSAPAQATPAKAPPHKTPASAPAPSPLGPLPSDPFASDPLAGASAETLSPGVLGWEDPTGTPVPRPLPADPFATEAPIDPFAAEEPSGARRGPPVVSVEIEDDDDDESFPSDPGASVESETFYLAPPPPGSTSLDADLRDLGDNELDDLPENLLGELLEDALDMPRSRHTQGGSLSSANAPTDPGEKAPTSPPAPRPGGAPTKGISSADVGYLFGGYAVFSVSDQHHIFGRRYGKKLVDAHEYKGTRLQDAYRSFVSDKVREGFAPRTDLTRDAPAESKLRPLDMDTLTTAMRELA